MKASLVAGVIASFAAIAHGANYPTITTRSCSKSGCAAETSTIIWDYSSKLQPSQYAANGAIISGDSLKLQLKAGNGPRVYLGANNQQYKSLKLVGKEIAYDVETSQLDCNMNGALYTVQMPLNGAVDGTGYCDANGVGGKNCEEFDIWEANKYATAMTAHPTAYDAGGCGINPYAQGRKTFYGPGSSYTVDTTRPFTVLTQFITSGSQVSEIKRIYQQNGKSFDGGSLTSSCKVGQMGQAMQGGSVLAFSIWSSTSMGWLDAGNNGPCPTGSTSGDATITFSNIRVGDIGTTTSGASPQPTTSTPQPSSTTKTPQPTGTTKTPAPTNNGGSVARWGQCGGNNYSGPTKCAQGTCVKVNEWYSQCQ